MNLNTCNSAPFGNPRQGAFGVRHMHNHRLVIVMSRSVQLEISLPIFCNNVGKADETPLNTIYLNLKIVGIKLFMSVEQRKTLDANDISLPGLMFFSGLLLYFNKSKNVFCKVSCKTHLKSTLKRNTLCLGSREVFLISFLDLYSCFLGLFFLYQCPLK